MCGIWAIFGSDGDIAYQCNSAYKISHRGPDAFRIENINHFNNSCLAFYRLAIVDDMCGMQPMKTSQHPNVYLIYNGEIYNFKELQKQFNFQYDTACDGESIIHLYVKGGIEYAARHLDGVFSFVLLDTAKRQVFLGRDTFGVRPMLRIKSKDGFLAVCSEGKGLMGLSYNGSQNTAGVEHYPPGHVESYFIDVNGKATMMERKRFHKIGHAPIHSSFPLELGADIKENIRALMTVAVKKRMMADRRIGCLLSGGLDSSVVTALTVKLGKEMGLSYKIQTFSIGMKGSTDLAAARTVSKYLNTDHHEIIFTPQEGIDALEKVIYHLESYDSLTIRGSICMYLVSKYIKENTDSTVILSGEGSDEIAEGYIYFHKAPSAAAANEDSKRLCNDLYMYDVLRTDRTTSAWGLEIRVPFLDHRFSSFYISLPDEIKMPHNGIEKHLLRSAFSGQGLLPDEIVWRPKEGFSDGVSSTANSWHEILQRHLDEIITNEELEASCKSFTHNAPKSKEALHYRKLFEKFYPGMGEWIPYYWMPRWIAASDPSARALENYSQ